MNSNVSSSSVPPSFRGELYFLIAKFLENGPCKDTATRLKTELTEKGLLQPRYDWKGVSHAKTFRDMEEEFDPSGVSIPKEHLLQLCFDLCNVNPAVPSVRSLLSHARLEAKRRQASANPLPNIMHQIHNKSLGIGHYPNSNLWNTKGNWHEKHLCRQLKRLRKTLGHLSSVYCLTFDRTGRIAFTGADDMLVKCWNVADGRLLFTFRGGAAEVSDMTVSHDNRMLAVATLDKIARVWNLHTGEPIAVLTRHTGTLTGINFSSYIGAEGQRYLACTSSDGTAAFWRYRYATCSSTGSKHIPNPKTDTNSSFKVEFDELPTRWCERSRPGKAKIISSCFSPGGLFFCTGSADHFVRVYQMDCPDGPQRILEEGEHDDQVDSIQWCNTSQLRLLSGSSDGTARIWTYHKGKWTTIVLNMKDNEVRTNVSSVTVDVENPISAPSQAQHSSASLPTANLQGRLANERRGIHQQNLEQRRPARRAAAQAAAIVNAAQAANDQQSGSASQASRPTRDISGPPGNASSDQNQLSSTSNHDEKCAVTMVQWSTDDTYAITAIANFQLKVWNPQNGCLVTTLQGHSSLVYTVEPHPLTENIFLSAGHDGYLKVWEISTSKCLFSSQNIIDMQGHAAVYDAKWSPEHGNVICATDSHGHLLFYGTGSSECYEKYPAELFFHTDYRPLLRDSYHNVVDEQTQTLPHLMPPPLLIDSEGSPYSSDIQELFYRNIHYANHTGPATAMNTFNVNYPQTSFQLYDQNPSSTSHEPRITNSQSSQSLIENLDHEAFYLNGSRNASARQQNVMYRDNEEELDLYTRLLQNEQRQNEQLSIRYSNLSMVNSIPVLTSMPFQNINESAEKHSQFKYYILKPNICHREVEEKLKILEEKFEYEKYCFKRENGSTDFEIKCIDNYSTPKRYKDGEVKGECNTITLTKWITSRKSRKKTEIQSDSTSKVKANTDSMHLYSKVRRRLSMPSTTFDHLSMDLSAYESEKSINISKYVSKESTTEVSSEHSDWGSGDSKEPEPSQQQQSTKKRSPKNKRKRNAAEKCRERMLKPGDQITDQFIPSPWLAESIPRKSPFFPQIGDILMYFKQGHERYVDLVKERKAYKINMKEQNWMKRKNLKEVCMVRISGIKWEIRPPRLCVLKLSILSESNGRPTGEHFTIKYHDMNDVVDFLVLRQTFNSYKGKHWKNGDRIRCQIDDCWWKGTVQKIVHHDASKKSPFLSIYVNWDNGEKEFLSPWDLEALDNDSSEIADGTYATQEELKSCLYKPSSEEWNCMGRESECTRISEALESIMSLAIAEPFNYPVDLTNYPEYMLDVEYPMDLSLIKARVDNLFYRRIAAIQRDLKYIYENAASFNRPKSDIVRNAKIITKLADEIVSNTNKSKTDVSSIYHRLSENFEWSPSSSDEEENNESQRPSSRASRASRASRSSSQKSPNLNPKKWKHDCNLLLNEIVALPFSQPFREPVSEIEFPDYHRYIATPMDFSTVRESLHIGDYNSPLEFEKDVHLIFRNSKEYNTVPGSKVLKMTHKMEEWFDDRFPELVGDWRKMNRRLTAAKQKHKAKMRHSSGASSAGPSDVRSKGKGKGKGKGQSNRISRPSRSVRDNSDSDQEESDETETEENDSDETETSPEKPKKSRISISKRNQRKRLSGDSSDSENENTKSRPTKRAGISVSTISRRSSGAALKRSSVTQDLDSKPIDCPLDLQVEEEPMTSEEISPTLSNGSGQRRMSSRVPKQPIRFRDGSSEVEESPGKRTSDRTTKCKSSMKEENESEDETKPIVSTSQSSSSAINVTTSPTKSVTETLRSVRIRRHKKRDESYVYSDTNEKEENIDSASNPPVGSKRKANRADSDSEDEPLVKKSNSLSSISKKRILRSGDEEDLPLSRKKSNQRPVNGHSQQSIDDGASKQSPEVASSSRPVRSAARAAIRTFTENQSESDDEKPLRRAASHTNNSPRKNVAFAPEVKPSAPQLDHDSSEDSSSNETGRKRKTRRLARRPNRNDERPSGRKRRSEESESEFSESELEESQTSGDNEDEDSHAQTSDEDFVCHSSPSKDLGMRGNLRNRNVKPQRRAVAAIKKGKKNLDSDGSENGKYDRRPKRKNSGGRQETAPRRKLASRNSTREDNPSSDDYDTWGGRGRNISSQRQKRLRVARRNYDEAASDNSSSGRENRRPTKRPNLRKNIRSYDNEDDSDSDEDDQMKSRRQATVTSRGRISKPNPRVI